MNFHQRSKSKSSITNTKKKPKQLIPTSTMKTLKICARDVMNNKYSSDMYTYSKKIITDIIYNEKSHIVAKFKDFLIYDDLSEFLKRSYKYEESYLRLPKIIDYYDNYSKIFPNYIMLNEAKYIYKNIQKKQKMIDNQHRYETDKEKNKKKVLEEDNVFNTDIYDSIMNQTETLTNMRDDSSSNLVAFNYDIGQKVNIFQIENSFSSIERLIDNIGEAEKQEKQSIEIVDKKHNILKLKDSPFVSPPISHRDKINKVLSPIKAAENIIADFRKTSTEKSKLKTIDVNSVNKANLNIIQNFKIPLSNIPTHNSRILSGNKDMNTISNNNINYLTNKKLTDSIINRLINKEDNFESNLLQKKYKEIKNKNRMSSDISNITALKEKMRMENGSTLYTANPGSSINAKERGYSSGKNKYEVPDSARTKKDSDMNSNNSNIGSSSLSHKNSIANLAASGSSGKMTNNIFYIINQNPQVNTQITIVNNNATLEKSELNTARERDCSNTKMIFKVTEKNNFKKLHNLKPEIYNVMNKSKNTIPANRDTSLKGPTLTNNTKTIAVGTTARLSSNPSNSKMKVPLYVKNERDSTPILTARQSNFKNNLATINYDENNSHKSNLYDKYLIRGTFNSDKKTNTTTQKFRKASSRLESQVKVKENNYVSPIPHKLATINHNEYSNFDNKYSLSPNVKLANDQNTLISSYTHRKTNSNIADFRSTISTTNSSTFKPVQLKVGVSGVKDSAYKSGGYDQPISKLNPITTNNNGKLNQTKGIPIKNFKDLIKQNTQIKPIPNSDRTHMIKVDRLNKLK